MSDFNDVFIKLALRNWSANQTPSRYGKAKLIKLARSMDRKEETEDSIQLEQISLDRFKRDKHRSPKLLNSEKVIDPINQTRLWLLHFSPFLASYLA